jgi:16S rRNA (adenine1518-N6/adenine1519-N6)-dimethyltransferase
VKEHRNRDGLHPKKSLGQNFLVSKSVAGRITDAVSPAPGELIFEIGPGQGALTVPLGKSGARIVAYEIDAALAAIVREKCEQFTAVEVVTADIRDVDLEREASERDAAAYKLVGNIPYHLTSPILADLPRWKGCEAAVLMVQREVGERIMAAPGERRCGILTVYLQSYFAVTRVARIRPGSFRPRPKVESVVLKFAPKDSPSFLVKYDAFLIFLKRCFAQRRKKLKHVFRDPMGIKDATMLMRFAEKAGVDLEKRPEELSLEEWFMLYRNSRGIGKRE